MKKLLMILSCALVACVLVSCGEDKKDPKTEITDAYEQMYKAIEADSPDEFKKIFEEMKKKYVAADDKTKEAYDKAETEWIEANPEKLQEIREAVYSLGLNNKRRLTTLPLEMRAR